MTTLADSFLADLDDLDDEGDMAQEPVAGEGEEEGDEKEAEAEDEELPDIETLDYDNLNSVAKLQQSQKFHHLMEQVDLALAKSAADGAKAEPDAPSANGSSAETQATSQQRVGGLSTWLSVDDPEYQLILDCNTLIIDIDNEIAIVHNFIRDNYRLKFPELESLVLHPIDYARVVRRIGNEMDLTLVDLEGLLPSATIMVVSVTASTTTGKPLPEDALQRTMDACDRALALDEAKRKSLSFVESRMGRLAPNLSAVVGSAIASQLVGAAGGLLSLAGTPSCNVLVLGAKRKTLAGYSTATALPHTGFIFNCEIVQATPPPLRIKACRLVAGKCTLAARVDATGGDPEGRHGKALREEISRKIEKWQEPPPARQPKPLPVPDAEPKKKRGGRRHRKMKERYGVTDMRKLANRMAFGVTEETLLGDGIGEGFGMLGQAGSGKLRVAVAASNLKTKVAKKFKEKSYGSSGNTSGLSSSLAFTPVQGIELSNPQALQMAQLGTGTQSTYFSETGTFSKIKRT